MSQQMYFNFMMVFIWKSTAPALMVLESPELKKVVFAAGKTRPQEALFMALEKHLFERGLARNSRNSCQII